MQQLLFWGKVKTMINRLRNRRIIVNNHEMYENFLKERDKKKVEQYSSPNFKYFTEQELKKMSYIEYVWSTGDRLYKISERFLGSKTDWWIILRFNKLKNEVDIKAGDVIKIPTNIEMIALTLEG
jgi:hypothetical protein